MTTHELARLLLAGPDVTAYLDGYEGGLVDVRPDYIHRGMVQRDTREDSYFGPHGGNYDSFEQEDDGEQTPGLVLSRHSSP